MWSSTRKCFAIAEREAALGATRDAIDWYTGVFRESQMSTSGGTRAEVSMSASASVWTCTRNCIHSLGCTFRAKLSGVPPAEVVGPPGRRHRGRRALAAGRRPRSERRGTRAEVSMSATAWQCQHAQFERVRVDLHPELHPQLGVHLPGEAQRSTAGGSCRTAGPSPSRPTRPRQLALDLGFTPVVPPPPVEGRDLNDAELPALHAM